jgi:DNA-binding MarR family transcriptional regulator
MKIEEAIKQKKFANEHEKLAVNILFTAGWLDGLMNQRLKPFGISPQQYNVLRILRGSHPKPLRLADISERMIDKMSNATRLVEKLRVKGFLKREICESNRRQVDIWITEKGTDALERIDASQQLWLISISGITKEEAEVVNNLLDKLRD